MPMINFGRRGGSNGDDLHVKMERLTRQSVVSIDCHFVSAHRGYTNGLLLTFTIGGGKPHAHFNGLYSLKSRTRNHLNELSAM